MSAEPDSPPEGNTRDPETSAPGSEGLSFEETYQELRVLARSWIRRLPVGQTLQPTGVVHEAFAKLAQQGYIRTPEDRRKCFGLLARAMRAVIADSVRRRKRLKRGEGWHRISLGGVADGDDKQDFDVLALHEALEELDRSHDRHSRIIELRYFAGLSIQETAETLGVSESTVNVEWRMARAWLAHRLRPA